MYVFYGDTVLATVIAVIATGLFLLWKYIAKNDDYWAKKGITFAPRHSPWDMYKLLTVKPLNESIIEDREKYGKVFGSFNIPPKLSVVVGEPELLRDILVKDFHVFPLRTEFHFGDEMMDNMVSAMNGDDWKRVRTIMTPAFTSKRMRTMGSIINDCSKTVVKIFDQHFQEKKSVDCKSLFGAYTMDVIASAAFATKIDSHNDPENVFVKNVKRFFSHEMTFFRFLFSACLPKGVQNFIRRTPSSSTQFFRDVIQRVVKERKESGQRYNDLLQVLMDALEENRSEDVEKEHKDLLQDDADQYGSVISEEQTRSNYKFKTLREVELLAQCVMFFTVGYETTASTLTFLCYNLAVNAEWQEKLIREVDDAYAKSKEMSYDSVRGMKVLDAVLSESLRMFPPALVSERKCVEDYKLGNTGITIKKGMNVIFPIYSMHYDPDFFEDPQAFNPERFMTSDPGHPQYAYLPFGAGPRNCLGMRFALLEIKLCVANILRHYRFRTAPETKIPLEFKKGSGFLTLDKLPLTVEKRTDVKI